MPKDARRRKGPGILRRTVKQLEWDVLALYLARKDRVLPLRSRIFAALAVGYTLSPVDLIPDFIPVLGYLDDIIIVPALVGLAVRSLPEGMIAEYRERARCEFSGGMPKALLAGMIIGMLWAAVILLAAIWLLRHVW